MNAPEGRSEGGRGGGWGPGGGRKQQVSRRRVRAVFRKELREYRRKRTIVIGMGILPLVFLVQPLVSVFALPASASAQLAQHHELLYLLGIPALVPATLAAYAVVGERQQGTLEPVLTTPVRREEFLLGKALACFLPSVAVAYAVFLIFVACVELFAQPGVAPALLRGSDLLAQLLFTPLLAGWSIWVGIAISTRATADAERARVNVTRTLRAAIDRITRAAPVAGTHLSSSIRTGTVCRYQPAPGGPARWHT